MPNNIPKNSRTVVKFIINVVVSVQYDHIIDHIIIVVAFQALTGACLIFIRSTDKSITTANIEQVSIFCTDILSSMQIFD